MRQEAKVMVACEIFGEQLVVPCQAPKSRGRCGAALDHPASGQQHEAAFGLCGYKVHNSL